LLEANDIVFGRKGAVERHVFIQRKNVGWFQGSDCLRLRFKSSSIEPRFISYIFLTEAHQQWMKNQCSHAATMASLNQDIISRIPLNLPPIPTQRKIAAILSAYDDLIENNTRRIKIQEEMAQALYCEWFVHFRFPGHEKVRMVDSPLGRIPEGWEVKTLGDMIEVKKGKNITKDSAKEGGVPVVAGGLRPAYYHDAANAVGPVITISASGANAGFVNLYHEDIWASDCSYISSESTDYLYYFYLNLNSRQEEIFGLQKGAAQPHVYPMDLMRLRVISVPEKVVAFFEESISNNFLLICNLVKQNKLLGEARNQILPRLMNGEIVV
jgi:type I restriction enzyme, S subunit